MLLSQDLAFHCKVSHVIQAKVAAGMLIWKALQGKKEYPPC